MKQLTLAVILLALAFGTAAAQDGHKENAKDASTTTAKLICPVTGEDADPEVTYDHEGKTYSFCCEGCVSRFKKDPAKFIKASEKKQFDPCDHPEGEKEGHAHETAAPDNGKAVINTGKDLSAKIVNTICPVMNEEVDPKVTTVSYKGKVYGFCCKSCIKKFANDPEKYLKKLKGEQS